MQAVFYQRDFSEKLSINSPVNVERYSHHMFGGPLRATLTAPAGADRWELMKLLRCPVEIYGQNKAVPVWWGFVNKVTVPQGIQQYGRGLDNMYNSIQVRYGQDNLTETGENAVSIAEYGTKELILRAYNLTGLEAAQLRSVELEDKQNPKTEIEFSSGGDVVEIECVGWYDTLRWKHYTNTTEGNVTNTTQISTIVANVGQFIRSTLIEDAAGVASNQARDARDGLSCVNELLQAGTSNYHPLLAQVDRNRNLRVWERAAEPPAGAVDYIMRDDGRLETVAGGTLLPDEYCTVGKWVQAKDSPLDFAFFIESAEYVVEADKTTYRPAGAYEQRRLAKYIADVVTGDGPHVWSSLIPPALADPQTFEPFWVALGKEGDSITAVRGVVWDSINNVVYVTGQFTVIGGVEATNFARLDMATGQWYALNTTGAPDATNYGWSAAILGNKVYFGTQGAGVGCFWEYDITTSTWTDLSDGTSGPVNALAVDGTDVYLGGAFTEMPGSANSNYISKWNLSTFDALGTGMTYSGVGTGGVYDIAISGGVLYAVGKFDDAGGTSVLNVAAWDGADWSALGPGIGSLGNSVRAVEVFGGRVYTDSGGVSSGNRVYAWDGTQWVTVGETNGTVQGLTVSGDGAVLYAIGNFTDINGIACGNSSYWDGGNWYTMSQGLSGATIANGDIAMFDSVHPIAVGNFTTADGKPALGIAMYITTLQGLIDHLTNTGGVSRPGGPDQAVQYNYDGRFGGSKYFLWDYVNRNLILGGYAVPGGGSNSWVQIAQGLSPGHLFFTYGAGFAGYIRGIHANGTYASPTAAIKDDVLMRLRGSGQYGTGINDISASVAYLQLLANTTFSSTDQATRIELFTTPQGSTTPVKSFLWADTGADMLESSTDYIVSSTDRWGFYFKSDGMYYRKGDGAATGPLGIGGSGSGTTDHAALGNLDYANAGHTGFAASTDLDSYVLIASTDYQALTDGSVTTLHLHDYLQALATHGENEQVPASSSRYLSLLKTGGLAVNPMNFICRRSGTISTLFVKTTGAQPGTGTQVVNVRKNNVDTALTVTISSGAAAGDFEDTAHSFSVAAGDGIAVHFTNNASSAGASIAAVAVEFMMDAA